MKYSPERFISIVFLQAAVQIFMKNAMFIQRSPEFMMSCSYKLGYYWINSIPSFLNVVLLLLI